MQKMRFKVHTVGEPRPCYTPVPSIGAGGIKRNLVDLLDDAGTVMREDVSLDSLEPCTD